MIRNKLLLVALAAGMAVGLAGIFGALPAVGQASPPSSPVVMGSTAQILNRGAAAQAFAYVACAPGDSASLAVSLNQRSGSGIASGSGFVQPIPCNGQILTISVPVAATGKPFVKGSAFGQATLFDCGPTTCGQATDSRSVTLTKK